MRKLYNEIAAICNALFMLGLLLTVAGCNKPRYDLVAGGDQDNPSGKRRKVLVIGINGVRGDVILNAEIWGERI